MEPEADVAETVEAAKAAEEKKKMKDFNTKQKGMNKARRKRSAKEWGKSAERLSPGNMKLPL